MRLQEKPRGKKKRVKGKEIRDPNERKCQIHEKHRDNKRYHETAGETMPQKRAGKGTKRRGDFM